MRMVLSSLLAIGFSVVANAQTSLDLKVINETINKVATEVVAEQDFISALKVNIDVRESQAQDLLAASGTAATEKARWGSGRAELTMAAQAKGEIDKEGNRIIEGVLSGELKTEVVALLNLFMGQFSGGYCQAKLGDKVRTEERALMCELVSAVQTAKNVNEVGQAVITTVAKLKKFYADSAAQIEKQLKRVRNPEKIQELQSLLDYVNREKTVLDVVKIELADGVLAISGVELNLNSMFIKSEISFVMSDADLKVMFLVQSKLDESTYQQFKAQVIQIFSMISPENEEMIATIKNTLKGYMWMAKDLFGMQN